MRRLSLDLDQRHVVLTGENGAGKTNLMEAVSFLSPGRGLRRAAYADVARVGAEARLLGLCGTGGHGWSGRDRHRHGRRRGGTERDACGSTARRQIRVDELLDHLRVLWLTPAMDGLFTGGSSDRRRFLDRLVLSLDPEHGRRAPATTNAPCAAATSSCPRGGRIQPG